MTDAPWTRLFARIAMWLAIIALVVAGVGVTLARYDLIAKIAGLYAMAGGAFLATLAALIALVALFLNMRWRAGVGIMAGVALVIGGGYCGFMVSRMVVASKVPAIHDITTSLADPPQFTHLRVRADNLVGVGTVEHWRELHGAAYALRPIMLRQPVATVIANAERLARARGWDIAVADPATGRLEATATVSFIRFEDQVVLRVTPMPDGSGSVVEMRSVSKIGVSDLGVNARRISEFLTALSAA
ncbi:MAG: DUF1499 domain-containing protein [Pseudomonadota bacterium]